VTAIGVQMQPIVVAPPDRRDRVRLFQDDDIEATRLETSARGEASRPAPTMTASQAFARR
jgi:hypothetical protein